MVVAQTTTESDQTKLAMAHTARWLGVPSLNAHQKQALCTFLGGKDVFVSLPTGLGKSLCFQSLPFIYDYLDSGPELRIIEDR